LFLHGWGSSKDAFSFVDSLKGFTITRVDLYGFGSSPHPMVPVDLDYYVDGVKELMANYSMENVIVIGHSFGGRIAIKLAQSSRVAGVVLVDSAGLRPKRGLKYYYKVLVYKIAKIFGKNNNYGSQDYRACVGAMRGTFVKVVNEDLKKYAKRIPCPTLLIWGEKDTDTPLYMYRKFLKIIPNAKGVILKGVGHFSFAFRPDEFCTLVKQFAINTLLE